jgi:hypothetical protein
MNIPLSLFCFLLPGSQNRFDGTPYSDDIEQHIEASKRAKPNPPRARWLHGDTWTSHFGFTVSEAIANVLLLLTGLAVFS